MFPEAQGPNPVSFVLRDKYILIFHLIKQQQQKRTKRRKGLWSYLRGTLKDTPSLRADGQIDDKAFHYRLMSSLRIGLFGPETGSQN